MTYINAAAWLAVILCFASYLTAEPPEASSEECQVYDRLGRGIGCEVDDLADRFTRKEHRSH
jgi:hypothetical protein